MQKIRIDFDNPGLPQHISAVENDSQSRFFQATLYENGKAYTAPEGAAYSIMYRGFGPQNQGWYDTINDGAGKRAACAVSGNVVTCEIARQALQVPGHVSIVLCVTTGKGYMLKSWPIECDCKNDRYDSTVEIQSFFYVTQISNESWTQAIQAVEDLKNTIDPTLSLSGKAADAKATGDALKEEAERAKGVESGLKENLGDLEIDFDSIVSTNKIPIFSEDKLLGNKPDFTAISLLGETIEIDNTDSQITSTMVFVHNVEKNKKYNINLNIISGSIYTFRVSSYTNTTFINESNVTGKQNYSFTMDDYSRIQIVITVKYTCPVLKAINCYFAKSDSKTTISLEALPEIPDGKILEISSDKIRNEYIDTNDLLYASKQLGMVYLYTNGLFDTKVKDGDYEVIGGALSETGSTRIGIEAKTGNKTISYPRLKIYDKYGEAKIFDKIMYEAGNVINPSSETNILFVGDSLIAYKYFSKHFKNYLHDLGLTNFKLVGRVVDNTDTDNKFEATGGYSWNNYVNNPSTLPSAYPNNWFWYNGKIDLNHYMETYCEGKVPNYIICNLGWNHKVNPNYSSDIDTIKTLCRTFLDAVHEQYPDCKIILNGIHHGMPNTFAYTLDYKKFAIELGHAYNAIAKETAYKSFVIYCDVAPYFDATVGMQTKTRIAWGNEQTYVNDYVHPNEEGYKMHAFADVSAFLYLVS